MSELSRKRDQLLKRLESFGSCAVAFSAGVDSTVVAKAAQLALGTRALAVTAHSPSLAAGELDEARQLADEIGIRHEVLETGEFQNPSYVRNAPDRCYHCKTELYLQLETVCERYAVAVVVNGANLDDRGDYRPGMRAAEEHRVDSPLAECGFHKADVRALAAEWQLPVWDKPATPCLSSRVAYGETVTPERLRRIDAAERFLRERGLRTVRVRLHRDELARIEVPAEALAELASPAVRDELVRFFQSIGFRYVTLDLAGFHSGSMNAVLPIHGQSTSSD